MKTELIGCLGHSLSDFFALEPKEIIDILEAGRKRIQSEHRLSYIAMTNAIGTCFGGKDFTYVDAFASVDEEGENKETYTDDEVEFLKNNF